ncbi:hypothetical protein NDU88_006416 [Pleurodeles waltl]|uniref:Uncharacterized protein n=1 Tax=Pleurodeles waltl TaxID=8319 RepID=A0AAV7SPJ4_PLEWA|nr:hypothetical protein NDU88_006416 [Pleurodeles waltl]
MSWPSKARESGSKTGVAAVPQTDDRSRRGKNDIRHSGEIRFMEQCLVRETLGGSADTHNANEARHHSVRTGEAREEQARRPGDKDSRIGEGRINLYGGAWRVENIEPKIDAVTLNVNLLRVDLHKVTDKVTTAEGQITRLPPITKRLEKKVQDLTKKQSKVASKMEDQEDRAHRNNIWITGVLEGAEGNKIELFVEDLILNKLSPKRLSNYFTIE